jgi:hypothetical protein
MLLHFANVPTGQQFQRGQSTFKKLEGRAAKCLIAHEECDKAGETVEFGDSVPVTLLGTSWRIGTLEEYNRVTSIPHAEKKYMPGDRASTVEWLYCGHKIATKTEFYKRKGDRKPSSVTYSIDPAFLSSNGKA